MEHFGVFLDQLPSRKAMNFVGHLRQLVQEDAKVFHSLRHGSPIKDRGAQSGRSRASGEGNGSTVGGGRDQDTARKGSTAGR